MKSYVIQYNAAECGFRNDNGVNTCLTQERDNVGEKPGYMKSNLYFIYIFIRLIIM